LVLARASSAPARVVSPPRSFRSGTAVILSLLVLLAGRRTLAASGRRRVNMSDVSGQRVSV